MGESLIQYLLTYNLYDYGSNYEVPIIYILGDQDWHNRIVAEEYFNDVNAPYKRRNRDIRRTNSIILVEVDEFTSKGGDSGDDWLKHVSTMTLDQLWLRNPHTLNEEELVTYEKVFPYFISGLGKLNKDTPIITEGAAFLPRLVNQIGVDKTHYVCMVPTREFQIHYYKKRLWVNDYLLSCSDKEKAFNNWMERDALFALSALAQARELAYATLVVDGSKTVDENLAFIESLFQLI